MTRTREENAADLAHEEANQPFTFDVKMFACITVHAPDEREARRLIRDRVDGVDANFGAWPNGDPILAIVSIDGTIDLVEVDD